MIRYIYTECLGTVQAFFAVEMWIDDDYLGEWLVPETYRELR